MYHCSLYKMKVETCKIDEWEYIIIKTVFTVIMIEVGFNRLLFKILYVNRYYSSNF